MSPTRPSHSLKQPSSKHLSSQLSLYSLAAAAAGVSVLALATPAEGEVVITRKTIPIPAGAVTGISLTNSGIDDFDFTLTYFSGSGQSVNLAGTLRVNNALGGSGVVGISRLDRLGQTRRYASALMRGAKIGPSANFVSLYPGDRIEASYYSNAGGIQLFGKWGGNPKNRYVGVRFSIKGETHYGWVRLSVNTKIPLQMSATITAYAYETVPNKRILAGTAEKPTAEIQVPENIQNQAGPSLGMLALGADGVPLWRSKLHSKIFRLSPILRHDIQKIFQSNQLSMDASFGDLETAFRRVF